MFIHQLAEHPLLGLARLGEVANKSSMDAAKKNMIVLGGQSVGPGSLFSKMPRHEAVADAVHRVSERPSWIKLSSLDAVDVEYDLLARPLICDLSAFLRTDLAEHMTWYGPTVFIASPHMVTPYHIDHECNCLFQIKGQKQVCPFDQNDRSLLTDQEIERFYTGDVESAHYQPMRAACGIVFNLNDQSAIHHPPLAPHWVHNGNSVSISLGLSFCTRQLDRRARVYQANQCMRRLGLLPSPPDHYRLVDSVKSVFINLFSKSHPLTQEKRLYTGIKRITAPMRAINRWLRSAGASNRNST
jgi:hypothetical protein